MWKVILQNGLLQKIIVTSFISIFLSPTWLHSFSCQLQCLPSLSLLTLVSPGSKNRWPHHYHCFPWGSAFCIVCPSCHSALCPSPDGHIKITAGKRVFYIPNQTSNEVLKYMVNRYFNSAAEMILAHEPALCQLYFPSVFCRFFHSSYF